MYNYCLLVNSGVRIMKPISKFKVIRHQPKSNVSYPLIRLPQEYSKLAGEMAYVYKIEYKDKPLFVISFDEYFEGEVVVHSKNERILEQRLEELERKVLNLENNNNQRR